MRPERIVVVDDDEISLSEKVAALRLEGFRHIFDFVNPVKIIEKFEELAPIDLLITDWQMNPIDGIELIDELKCMSHQLKVLLVSKAEEKPPTYRGAFLKKDPIPEVYESSLLACVRVLLDSR